MVVPSTVFLTPSFVPGTSENWKLSFFTFSFVLTEKDQEPVWSDEATTGDPVIWGDQITNTIKKLKSLTFFAVGSTPVPAPTASTPGTTEAEGSKQNEDKTKRKLKPQGGTKKGGGGRKGKKSGSTNNQVNVTTDGNSISCIFLLLMFILREFMEQLSRSSGFFSLVLLLPCLNNFFLF